jgi:hypothetical protein
MSRNVPPLEAQVYCRSPTLPHRPATPNGPKCNMLPGGPRSNGATTVPSAPTAGHEPMNQFHTSTTWTRSGGASRASHARHAERPRASCGSLVVIVFPLSIRTWLATARPVSLARSLTQVPRFRPLESPACLRADVVRVLGV